MSVEDPIWVAEEAYTSLLPGLPKGDPDSTPYVPRQLVVKLKAGRFDTSTLSTLCSAEKLELKGKINHLRLALVRVPADSSLEETRTRIAARGDVESVGLNYVFDLDSAGAEGVASKAITNDPEMVLDQWGLHQIGFNLIPASLLPTSAPTVALLDTGVDYNHPDLAGRVVKGPDYYGGDMDPMDVTGHGTHCAGVIAAINNNNIGIAGVCGVSKILAVRIGYVGVPVFAAAAGISYAADAAGVKVMSLSWGGYAADPYIGDAIAYAVGKGILVVAAAGNDAVDDSEHPHYPSDYPGVLAVGATDDVGYGDEVAYFSNWGGQVDIGAPGVNIYSTTPVNGSLYYAPMYDFSDGTSMATPFVAGAAAMMRGKWTTLTASQVSDLLTSTDALPVAPSPYGSFPDGVGRLDLYSAFQARLGTMPTATGAIYGMVVDANTGLALKGATITAKRGTASYTATSRADGTFTVTNLPPGTYTVSGSKTTYVVGQSVLTYGPPPTTIDVYPGEASPFAFIPLAKTQASDVYTAVLSWIGEYSGGGINELDSYLWLPGSLAFRLRYMVCWQDRGILTVHPYARLLRDEPSEMPARFWGPLFVEATTFRTKYTGQFTFAVNDYAWVGDWGGSCAVVQLYKGSALVGTYPVTCADGTGNWWKVFTIAGLSGAPAAVQSIDSTFPGPFGGEYFLSLGTQKAVLSFDQLPIRKVISDK